MCLSIHPLMNIWVIRTFWLLWIVLQWTFMFPLEHLILVLWGIYLGVKLLDHVVIWYLTYWKNVKQQLHYFTSHQQCMRVPIPLYPHQNLLFSVILIIAILVGMNWYHIVTLIHISLTNNDVEHLLCFLCLLAIKNYLLNTWMLESQLAISPKGSIIFICKMEKPRLREIPLFPSASKW